VSRLETRILRKRARKNSKTASFTLSNDQSYLAVEYFLSIAYKTRNQLLESAISSQLAALGEYNFQQ